MDGTRWKHRKGGEYVVLYGDALIEYTITPAVVYRAVKDDTVWIRPKAEFLDGRFTQIANVTEE